VVGSCFFVSIFFPRISFHMGPFSVQPSIIHRCAFRATFGPHCHDHPTQFSCRAPARDVPLLRTTAVFKGAAAPGTFHANLHAHHPRRHPPHECQHLRVSCITIYLQIFHDYIHTMRILSKMNNSD
jgi:hypothetical protein